MNEQEELYLMEVIRAASIGLLAILDRNGMLPEHKEDEKDYFVKELDMSDGLELIAIERKRQIEVEGWTSEWDAQHIEGELAIAGACYVFDYVGDAYNDEGCYQVGGDFWPWDGGEMKTTHDDYIRQLTKAGALIAAEIDRLHKAVL